MTFYTAATTPHSWGFYDLINVMLISALPMGIGLIELASSANGGAYKTFLDRAKKPTWAPAKASFHAGTCFMTLIPLGYATYLVIKNSAGLASMWSKIALIFYTCHAVFATMYGKEVKKQNYEKVAFMKIGIAVAAIAFTFAYRPIDNLAFWLSVPHVIWSIFSAVYHYSIHQMNHTKQ